MGAETLWLKRASVEETLFHLKFLTGSSVQTFPIVYRGVENVVLFLWKWKLRTQICADPFKNIRSGPEFVRSGEPHRLRSGSSTNLIEHAPVPILVSRKLVSHPSPQTPVARSPIVVSQRC